MCDVVPVPQASTASLYCVSHCQVSSPSLLTVVVTLEVVPDAGVLPPVITQPVQTLCVVVPTGMGLLTLWVTEAPCM